jgi:molybdopterin molybdotransferase
VKAPPLPLEEAQARLLALAAPLPVEHVDPAGALGRYLAEPLLARRTQPACDLSAMDGYAVTEGDMAGPWRIVGESAAGHPYPGGIKAGETVRISTGALMPSDAAAVILQEDLARDGDTLTLTGDPPEPPTKHIRREGMDFRAGNPVLPEGALIGPAQVALAVAAGHGHLPVRRRPRLAILDSGDELAADPGDCAPHQIPASNGVMLAAMVADLPCESIRLGPVADTMDALAAALAKARHADVIVTSGGASVGDHDLVRPALEAWGAELDFWRIAIKPGKPLLVARRGDQIVLGLPGNPVSSFVTAYLFLLPLLRALLGAADPLPRTITARLATALKPNGARREFARADWNGREIAAQRLQDSGALSSLAASNALLDRPANAPAAAVGDEVRAYLLGNGGIA